MNPLRDWWFNCDPNGADSNRTNPGSTNPHTFDPAAFALVTADEVMTYEELRLAVARSAEALPDVSSGRYLVHLPFERSIAAIVAFLAIIKAGHVALVTSPSPEGTADIRATYAPDITFEASTGDFTRSTDRPFHALHPEVAVLLSTSGSTGSAKLVRLSHDNITSNAAAIASGLGLTAADRTLTVLPLHYSFGLSILTSHLSVGASIEVSDTSASDTHFWDVVKARGVTNFGVVPHLVDLIDASGGVPHDAGVRLIYQAGGKLSASTAKVWAKDAAEHGREFCVMYGATEATARMTISPTPEVGAYPDSVGHPIAGSSIRLAAHPEAPDGAGELFFRGPGVMLGYATTPDDLALGRMVDELNTGDLATIDDAGRVRIVGRASNFVKIAGLRIELSRVEEQLRGRGIVSCVTGEDGILRVAVDKATSRVGLHASEVSSIVAAHNNLSPAHVDSALLDALPLLENGKVDRRACNESVLRTTERTEQAHTARRPGLSRHESSSTTKRGAVLDKLGRLTGTGPVDQEKSFTENGGTSLNYVPAATVLSDCCGPLPRDWHHQPLSELLDRSTSTRRGALLTSVDSTVVLRAIAAITIIVVHIQWAPVLGGAHSLLVLAGFNLACFSLAIDDTRERWRKLGRTLAAVAIPTMVVTTQAILFADRYHWTNVVMLNWLLAPDSWVGNRVLWFIDNYMILCLFVSALFTIPRVRRWYVANPWRAATILTVIALIPRYIAVHTNPDHWNDIPYATLWLFTTGIAAFHARNYPQIAVTATILVVGIVGYFDQPGRIVYVVAATLVMMLVPRLYLPSFVVPIVNVIAASTLYIYLIQFEVFRWFDTKWIEFTVSIALGVALWWISTRVTRLVTRRVVTGVLGAQQPWRTSKELQDSAAGHR